MTSFHQDYFYVLQNLKLQYNLSNYIVFLRLCHMYEIRGLQAWFPMMILYFLMCMYYNLFNALCCQLHVLRDDPAARGIRGHVNSDKIDLVESFNFLLLGFSLSSKTPPLVSSGPQVFICSFNQQIVSTYYYQAVHWGCNSEKN